MTKTKELTDEEIIDEVVKGDKKEYEKIIRKYNPYLYKVGRSYNYNHEDTQDLMQDTFIDAYKNLAKFEKRSSFKTWIVRIMMNNCYHRLQKSSYKNEYAKELNENSSPMFEKDKNNPIEMYQNQELKKLIEDALSTLPQNYRMVFSLREINGMSTKETAELMHISESNVKVRLSRAKGMLRETIKNSYSETELFEFNLIYCDGIVERVMTEIEKLP